MLLSINHPQNPSHGKGGIEPVSAAASSSSSMYLQSSLIGINEARIGRQQNSSFIREKAVSAANGVTFLSEAALP